MRLRRWLQPEILIPALALGARLLPGPRTIDDAYITFRYARNLLSGHGLVFNPGEAVLGTTTPVYASLMAALGLASGGAQAPFPVLALIVNALADALTCWMLIRLGQRLGSRAAGIAMASVWAIAPMSVSFAIGGMETSLFIALLTATLYALCHDRPVAAAAWGALSLLTRPDALLLVLPAAAERVRRSLPRSRLNPDPLPIRPAEALVFALPLAAWAGLATLAYGSPLPHSILAKAAAYRLPPEAALVRLLQHYGTPFLEHLTFGTGFIAAGLLLYPVLFGLGALRALRLRPSGWPLFAFPWLYLLAFALANPLIFRWYLAPPLPAYMLGIGLGLARLAADLRRPRWIWLPLIAALAFTAHGWTLRPDHGPQRPAPTMAFIELELLYEQAAGALRPQIAPGQVLAAGDVGVLGYVTEARVLDTVGLNSPVALAHYPLDASLYAINYAVPPRLILEQQPDYLVLLEVYGRLGLLRDPAFQAAYALIERLPTDLYGSDGMLIFRRR